ncbi:MAG: YibE/F-like protein [candidate division WS6 bacterium OLB20]|uniref:YibE/F-like protein n=1 Tax=candidate division WS6 bacterium OLB20 TaxID=1617426 RepID=A0A136LYU5_9BACT|nr:MAG: YibE/F-like protein [candidate division WS6 bacterium OLB20]
MPDATNSLPICYYTDTMSDDSKPHNTDQEMLMNVLRRKLGKPRVIVALTIVAAFVLLLLGQTRLAEQRQASGLLDPIAEGSESRFATARVLEITDEGTVDLGGIAYPYQELSVELTSSERKGEIVPIRNEIQFGSEEAQRVFAGEEIVVTSTGDGDQEMFFVSDKYRFPSVLLLFVVFFGLTVLFAGWKGVTSLAGLGFTIYVLASYVVPSIVIGDDPMVVSLIGAVVIASVTYFLAHGAGKRIIVALAGTMVAIAIAAFLSLIFVDVARLFGTGSEEAVLLTISNQATINLKGLLLGGIIFGTLGVLDDVTTAQAAAVEELKRANPKLSMRELYTRASSIGREHIVSLVNTLVLAYIGSSFPLLLLFTLNNGVPLWLTFNSEFVIEEVIRSLIGSSVLIFAVPITTLIAAWVFSRVEPDPAGEHSHHHH